MKNSLHCLILAALAWALPAFADERNGETEAWRTPAIAVTNPERMLMEIDLKVLLRQYEKLKIEVGETRVQLALVDAGDLDAALTEAAKALAAVENDKTASKEDLDRARMKYSDSLAKEHAVLRSRLQVLEEFTERVRKEAGAFAQELAKQTAAESKRTTTQPQS